MIVIGAGRVGQALHQAALEHEQPLTLLSRSSDDSVLHEAEGEPIFVATRNDELNGVLGRVPPHRHGDLVFPQNGMLRAWLAQHGIRDATRGILLFAVPKRGDPVDAGGTSPFTGPRASAVVSALSSIGVPAEQVSGPAFAEVELEKLLWLCVFGVIGQATGLSVGDLCFKHLEDITALTAELYTIAAPAHDVDPGAAVILDRMITYSRSIPAWQATLKEWTWRNGWLVAEAERLGIDAPLHTHWLERAQSREGQTTRS